MLNDLLAQWETAWRWRELDAARCRQTMDGGPGAQGAEPQAAELIVRGYLDFREARPGEALERAVKALELLSSAGALSAPAPARPVWYARALSVRSVALLELGEFGHAGLSLREQLRASRAGGDPEMEGSALHDLGVMHAHTGAEHAGSYLEAALEVFGRAADPVGLAFSNWSLGELRERQGRLPEAHALYDAALSWARTCGHLHLEVLVSSHLAELELRDGDPLLGERQLRAALERQQEDAQRPLWIAVPPLARLLLHAGRLQEARALLEQQLKLALAAGMQDPLLPLHGLLSEVHEALGEPLSALRHAREHFRVFQQRNAREQASRVRGLEVLHRTELAQAEAQAQRERASELQNALNDLERMHRQLERQSRTDELTGTFNRHHLMTGGLALLQGAPDSAVAILDIDHFKRINDTHGHDGGDRVLRAFARHLQAGLRGDDLLARFGGEEFVVLFPHTPLDAARARLDALRAALLQRNLGSPQTPIFISFTAGVVGCPSGDLLDALRRADHLLYRGKRAGRNSVLREETGAAVR